MSSAEKYLLKKERTKLMKKLKIKYYVNSIIFMSSIFFIIFINEKFIEEEKYVFFNILSLLFGIFISNKVDKMEKLKDEYWDLKGSEDENV